MTAYTSLLSHDTDSSVFFLDKGLKCLQLTAGMFGSLEHWLELISTELF